MFAADHAATALLIKRRFPSVSLTPILVSVQAMELAWVGLNYLGVERTTTESTVHSVADIHLAYMPVLAFDRDRHRQCAAGVVRDRKGIRPTTARESRRHRDLLAPGSRSVHSRSGYRSLARSFVPCVRCGPLQSRADVGVRARVGLRRVLLVGVSRNRIALCRHRDRQSRQLHAVLGGDSGTGGVPCRASVDDRHVRLRADRRDVGAGRPAGQTSAGYRSTHSTKCGGASSVTMNARNTRSS